MKWIVGVEIWDGVGISNTCKTVCAPLTTLFNLSLKVSNVMPLFKKGDKSFTNNYRPVSLITSNVGKSFERIIFKHMYNHITEKNGLLYKYQSFFFFFFFFFFLPSNSTVHHLTELTQNTCIFLENYETNCQVVCDISKAFDQVWHKGLLYKLERYGIMKDLLLWINSY